MRAADEGVEDTYNIVHKHHPLRCGRRKVRRDYTPDRSVLGRQQQRLLIYHHQHCGDQHINALQVGFQFLRRIRDITHDGLSAGVGELFDGWFILGYFSDQDG